MPRESTVHRGARRVPLLRGKVQTSLRLGSAHSGFPCPVLALLGLPLPSPGERAFPTQTCSPLTPELRHYLCRCSQKWTSPGTSDPPLFAWVFLPEALQICQSWNITHGWAGRSTVQQLAGAQKFCCCMCLYNLRNKQRACIWAI